MPDTRAPIPKMPFAQMLRYRAEAAAVLIFIGFSLLFGLDGASAMGGWIGRNILRRSAMGRRARDHLTKAYPEKPEAEIEAIALEMFDNLGRPAAESAHLDKLKMHRSDPRFLVSNIEIADKARASGKGVIFVSGHFANWETMPFA